MVRLMLSALGLCVQMAPVFPLLSLCRVLNNSPVRDEGLLVSLHAIQPPKHPLLFLKYSIK